MRPRMFLLFRLLMVLASLLIMAGCTGPQAKIRKVDQPKEKELRANWKNYHTYCLGSYAMLFQLKGDQIIQRDDPWREVTSDEMASGCASVLIESSPVMQVLGENEEVFGYVIYNFDDQIWASIIDPKTVRLFYRVHPKGP
ncbi:MAG: hypothetical protein EHM37_04120 [Deltaproteobacteria bacterium]|nr:MAG: hypothetical protein EHM37_12550 [Deltaproteobacteria bacterium]RPJ15251.1 MAG: hypothetical protein EHM37_04120 [Deltaproteobacteria bacterium]